MRTLIFGARGQLGRDLMKVFSAIGETAGYDLPETDITVCESLPPLLESAEPDLIINAAAYTNVDGAEDDLDGAFKGNEIGARHVAELAARQHIPIVYYSTDYVFRGDKATPYAVDDPIDPVTVYGRSKAAGETATRSANPKHFILRTAWLYGPGGNNFVEKILRAAETRPELKVVTDETGSPTHTLDLAEITLVLVKTKHFGTYHAVNSGACTRFELAREILRLARSGVSVAPCLGKEFPSKAKRPQYSVLDTSTLEQAAGCAMRPWQEALADYMKRRAAV